MKKHTAAISGVSGLVAALAVVLAMGTTLVRNEAAAAPAQIAPVIKAKPGCAFGFKKSSGKFNGTYTCRSVIIKCPRGRQLFAEFDKAKRRFVYTCAMPQG